MDIREIASILDEHIEKANLKPEGKVERLEKSIAKSISFNPLQPHVMNHQSGYHNPYRMLPDGSYVPQAVEYWEEQGKDPEHYRHSREFLTEAGVYIKKSRDKLLKALPDMFKATRVPVGHRHEYEGQEYAKVAEDHWVPSEGTKTAKQLEKEGQGGKTHQAIEQNAGQVAHIQGHVENRAAHEGTKDLAIKETLDAVKAALGAALGQDVANKFGEQIKELMAKKKEDSKPQPDAKKTTKKDKAKPAESKKKTSAKPAKSTKDAKK